jgi:uncharacterized protein (UPF0248 family)
MKKNRRSSPPNIHESFSDMALLMLATFVFLLVTIMITSKLAEENQLPQLKEKVSQLSAELKREEQKNQNLMANMDKLATMNMAAQMEQALEAAGMEKNSKSRKDLDLFVEGLKDIPGDSIHLMVDATGSMHGVTTFIIPILRIIIIRSGKRLDAITWFSDGKSETYQGSMGSMFDNLLDGAPFIGSDETIGRAFRDAARNAPAPGAYLLIGDEPSTDRIHYFDIPSPVFTIPLGKDNPETIYAYQKLAEETKGKTLQLELK